jgi:hypothetical protein
MLVKVALLLDPRSSIESSVLLDMKEIVLSILKVDYGLRHEAREIPDSVIFDPFALDVDDDAGVDPGDDVDNVYMHTT